MNLSLAIKNRRIFSVRSIRDWIEFNGGVTYIAVACNYPGVQVPENYVVDDAITLNISTKSCSILNFDEENNQITFSANFNKVNFDLIIPAQAIFAVWEKNTGVGENYPITFIDVEEKDTNKEESNQAAPSASHLKVVE